MPCNGSQNGDPTFPFFDGPFPPAEPTRRRRPGNGDCGGNGNGNGNGSGNCNGNGNGNSNGNGDGCDAPAYASFCQRGSLDIDANSPIPFNARSCPDRNIYLEDGVVRLRRPGAYAVSYTFAVPENYTFFSNLFLTMNGETVPGSATQIEKNTTSNSMVYSGQAIVQAGECAKLSLVSSEPVDITAGSSDPIATLVVHRL